MKNAFFFAATTQTNNAKTGLKKAFATCFAIFVLLFQADATNWYVSVAGADIPGNGTNSAPFRHIQYAISQAVHGDVINVKPGLYCENIDFIGKNITVKSLNGADQTIIQGDGTQSVVLLDNVSGNATLKGFSIRGGLGTVRNMFSSGTYSAGGGVLVYRCNYLNGAVGNKTILLSELKVYDNAAFNGGGIFVYMTKNANIERCEVFRNNATGHGGGVGYVSHISTLVVKMSNTLICNNNATINGGGMLVDYSTRLTMHWVTVAENTAPIGATMRRSNAAGVLATNCIFSPASTNDLKFVGGTAFNSTLNYCCLPNYVYDPNEKITASATAFTFNPMFKPAYDRFRLADASPCINSGAVINGYTTDLTATWPRLIGTPGQFDIGAYEMPFCGAYPRPAGEEDSKTVVEEVETIEERAAQAEPDFQIFPNPTSQTFEIAFPGGQGQELTVRIFDLTGKELQTETLNDAEQTTLDIAHLPRGIYMVKVGDAPAQKLTKI